MRSGPSVSPTSGPPEDSRPTAGRSALASRETAAEHIRNAVQVLAPFTLQGDRLWDDWREDIEAALSRLARALEEIAAGNP